MAQKRPKQLPGVIKAFLKTNAASLLAMHGAQCNSYWIACTTSMPCHRRSATRIRLHAALCNRVRTPPECSASREGTVGGPKMLSLHTHVSMHDACKCEEQNKWNMELYFINTHITHKQKCSYFRYGNYGRWQIQNFRYGTGAASR